MLDVLTGRFGHMDKYTAIIVAYHMSYISFVLMINKCMELFNYTIIMSLRSLVKNGSEYITMGYR